MRAGDSNCARRGFVRGERKAWFVDRPEPQPRTGPWLFQRTRLAVGQVHGPCLLFAPECAALEGEGDGPAAAVVEQQQWWWWWQWWWHGVVRRRVGLIGLADGMN